jgi:four helix bundle protein
MEKRKIEQVEELQVYQRFFDLATEVENVTKKFEADFRWLRSQLMRASESVCANLTEGFYSQYSTEYLQALYRCRREARETMTHPRYAMKVCVLSDKICSVLLDRYTDALKLLGKLIGSIENKIRERGKSKRQIVAPPPLTTDH